MRLSPDARRTCSQRVRRRTAAPLATRRALALARWPELAAPAGTTETIVEFIDLTAATSNLATAPVYYTVVVQGGGAVTATLVDNLGPALPNATSATLQAGDRVQVECIAADYPLFEAGPPANTSQTPTLLGAAGQADLSFSPPLLTTI